MTALADTYQEIAAKHAAYVEQGLSIDISRGKPSPEQLDLSKQLLSLPGDVNTITSDGADARNYGGDPLGLMELREIFAPLIGVSAEHLVAGGNSSLSMMHDCLVWALLRGVSGHDRPWVQDGPAIFLCPAPGYELHFRMCDTYGVRLQPVPVTSDGPDMDVVEAAVKDPTVKGMWCVPTHANPTQETFSDATVDRLARMETSAPDFRLFWDDAYVLHHFHADQAPARNILTAAANAGHPDRPLMFASTSKITHAGSGVGFMAASLANVAWYAQCRLARGPGEDKINQLRHAMLLKSPENVRALMARHAELLVPKFKAIDTAFRRILSGSAADWEMPRGGYFINVRARPGTARRAVELARRAGVKLTAAGSTWPGGVDPYDAYIRIAPSLTPVDIIETAGEIIALSVRLAELEAKLIKRRKVRGV